MPKVMPELHAPHGQPVDIVDSKQSRKLDLYIFSLVTPQGVQGAHLVGHLDSKCGRFSPVAHPEVGVRSCTVVMEVGDVERLRVQDTNVV